MRKTIRIISVLVIGLLVVNIFSVYGAAEYETDPLLPAFLSFLIPGGGQLINDQPRKAILHFGVSVGLNASYFIFYFIPNFWRITIAADMAWRGYSAYDAYQVAKERESGRLFGSSFKTEEEKDLLLVDVRDFGPDRSGELSLVSVEG